MTYLSTTHGAARSMDTATLGADRAEAMPERKSHLAALAAALMPRLFAKEMVVYETQILDAETDR